MITIDDLKKISLKTGKVLKVEDHPEADKLYLVEVDTGEGSRQLVAGLKEYYSKDELVRKNIIIVNNLEPATIRGQKSEGMLLAAQDDNTVSILTTDKNVKAGSQIK